jgi:pilus assembly protein CpaF
MLVQVVIESKGRSERRLIDVTTGVITIGRAPTCTLPIESTLISRTHVSVDMNGRHMRVTDSSTNGTLAGDRFVRGSSADVPFGVPIVLGDHTVWLEASDPSVAKTFESASEKAQKPTLPAPVAVNLTTPLRARARGELEIGALAAPPKNATEEALLECLAPVRPYLDDPSVSEILINGFDRIYVEREGLLERVPAMFPSREALVSAFGSLAQYVRKNVDEAHPILDGRLPDGSRVVALSPPVAPDGPHLAIRRSFGKALTVDDLVRLGSLTTVAAAALEAMVAGRLNIVIGGAIGSGKTALLSALCQLIPDDERIVVIEEWRELRVRKPHVLRLETRTVPAEAERVVRVHDLLRAALNLRADRLVLGDLRGADALEFVTAMTSGQPGCMTTLRAPRGAMGCLESLETMCTMNERNPPLEATRREIGDSVQLVVLTARLRDGSRKVTRIAELRGFDLESQRYALQDLFVRESRGVDENHRTVSELVPTGVEPTFAPQLEERGVHLPDAMKASPLRT